jgi:hypothetical protein
MIRIAALAFTCILTQATFSQSPASYCGTDKLSQQQQAFLDEFHSGNLNVSVRAGLTYIPVKVHIVGTNTGTGYYRTSDLYEAFCELNVHFQPVDFYFYIDGEIDYINNTDYYEHDYSVGQDMMAEHNVAGAVNMYIVSDPAGNCGYFSPIGDAVAIAKSCALPGGTTIAHELGHFFSLPHTFNGWEGGEPPANQKERADGSNCNTRGDEFCDTPADYLAYRWTCPFGGVLIDPAGDTVHPDGTFFMSYANDACTNRFSGQQIQAMRTFLILWRPELLGNSPPPYADLDPITLESPTPGATGIPADYVMLKWFSVPGASSYAVQASRFAAFTLMALDIVVTDTVAVVHDFEEGLNYNWRVKPLMATNTCEDYSASWQFTAGEATGLSPTGESEYISVYPNPVFQGQSIHLTLKQAVRVRLVDLRGSTVWTADMEAGERQVQLLVPAGVYFLEATSGTVRSTQRVAVM